MTLFHPGRCRFWKSCPGYSEKRVTCERDSGMFYGKNRHCGLYRHQAYMYSGRIGGFL